MSTAPPTNPHQITISPLLKDLVGHSKVGERDIAAARILVDDGELSEAQTALFLALLQASRHQLENHELDHFERLLDERQCAAKGVVSIAPLLCRLLEGGGAPADQIAEAVALILDHHLDTVQTALLLGLLAFTGLDKEPAVLVKTAEKMLAAANRADHNALLDSVRHANKSRGRYQGGLCDIVGTGGDGHSTFNVSTTASIIGSAHLILSKHGNRASSSTSGSADLLAAVHPRGPNVEAVTCKSLPHIYRHSSYAFLFAPIFHPSMKYVASLRKDLGISTIFNILGPLVNPVEDCIEARIVGVAKKEMGPTFAEALRMSGARKAMVVCGAENLDEISCAGKTFCWRLAEKDGETTIDTFELEPADFDLPTHPLSEVAGGKSPAENAEILMDLLANKLSDDDPVLHFVLMNAAALFAIAGLCECSDKTVNTNTLDGVVEERGPGGQKWKEGVRIARQAINEGLALNSFIKYIEATYSCHQ